MRPPMKPPSRTRHTFAGIRVNPSSDRGSVSLWVAVMAASVLVTLVLIVDGGAKIRAGNRADIAATGAARAAVVAVGPRPAGGSGQARLAVAAATARRACPLPPAGRGPTATTAARAAPVAAMSARLPARILAPPSTIRTRVTRTDAAITATQSETDPRSELGFTRMPANVCRVLLGGFIGGLIAWLICRSPAG